MLLLRQGHTCDVGAAEIGQIQPQTAPATADVEQPRGALRITPRQPQLGGEVALFGELRIIERLVGALEIGAAILPVGVEEERIQPAVEIVMVRDIPARAGSRIELFETAVKETQQPLQSRPMWHFGLLPEGDRQHVGDGALFDDKTAVHIGFAEFQFGIEQDAPFGGA